MQRKPSLSTRLVVKLSAISSRLRKKPPITPEQKLQARIDTLNGQAKELHAECSRLQQGARTFATRAETTKPPEAPPDRDALFQRDSNAPPSQYDAQVQAFKMLESEFASLEAQVGGFGKKLDKFVSVVESLKKRHAEPGAPMGRVEHQFESLDNAIFNLKSQRTKLSQAVSVVPIPAPNAVE